MTILTRFLSSHYRLTSSPSHSTFHRQYKRNSIFACCIGVHEYQVGEATQSWRKITRYNIGAFKLIPHSPSVWHFKSISFQTLKCSVVYFIFTLLVVFYFFNRCVQISKHEGAGCFGVIRMFHCAGESCEF